MLIYNVFADFIFHQALYKGIKSVVLHRFFYRCKTTPQSRSTTQCMCPVKQTYFDLFKFINRWNKDNATVLLRKRKNLLYPLRIGFNSPYAERLSHNHELILVSQFLLIL